MMKRKKITQPHPPLVDSAMLTLLGTICSRILGFVRDSVLLSYFPPTVTDAFVVAFRLPHFVRRLLGEGALAASFIPSYTHKKYLETKDPSSPPPSLRLVHETFTALLSLSFLFLISLWFLTPFFMQDWMKNTSSNSIEKIDLTISLSKIMLGYIVFTALSAFLSALAQAHHRFFIPALAPALFNLTVLGVIKWTLDHSFSSIISAHTLAWGVVLGGLLQMGLLFFVIFQLKIRLRWIWAWPTKGIEILIQKGFPIFISTGSYQILTLINAYFAVSLPEGSQSYLYASDRLLELPQSLLAASLSSALLPTFSQQISAGQKQEFLKTVQKGLHLFLYLALPCTIGLWLGARPIVAILFEPTSWTQHDPHPIASLLRLNAFILIFTGLHRLLSSALMSYQNIKLPFLITMAMSLFHICITSLLWSSWGLKGLAFCTLIASCLLTLLTLIAFQQKLGLLNFKHLVQAGQRWLPGLALLAGYLWVMDSQVIQSHIKNFHRGGQGLILLATLAGGACLYITSSKVCGSPECEELHLFFLKRLKSSRQK